MENISDFLKTGDKKVEADEASLHRIDCNSNTTIDSIKEIEQVGNDGNWGISVLASNLRWIGRNTDHTLASIDEVKDEIEKLKRSTSWLTLSSWPFRFIALASMALLFLMLYKACTAQSEFELLGADDIAVVENIHNEKDDAHYSADDHNSFINPVRGAADSDTQQQYVSALENIMKKESYFHTSSSVSEKWFALQEIMNQKRAQKIYKAILALENPGSVVTEDRKQEFRIQVEGHADIQTEMNQVLISLQSPFNEECSYITPCEIYNVPQDECTYKVNLDALTVKEILDKLKMYLSDFSRVNRNVVIEYTGSANLKGAQKCPAKNNMTLSLHRADKLRLALEEFDGYSSLLSKYKNVDVVVSTEPQLRSCRIGDTQANCEDKTRYARVVIYTR